ILARGGGTSLGGQATNAALVLDFSKYMNRVTAIDPERRIASVEPGVVQSHLNATLAPFDLFFAPDPSTKDRCTIGGMIGNNSCGAHSAAYGKTVDNLEGLTAILYDGTRLELGAHVAEPGSIAAPLHALIDSVGNDVRATFPKIPRRVSGYNLDELLPERNFNLARALVGSEGTLAITLRAELRVVPRPKRQALVVLGFEDIFAAADQMPWMLTHRPEALEGFDEKLPEFARRKGLDAVRLLPSGRAFLIVELGAEDENGARDRAEKLLDEARREKSLMGAVHLEAPGEQTAVWRLRESGLGAGAYVPGFPRTWPGAEDTAVGPEKLGAYLRRFANVLAKHNLQVATYYGHFGEGCVHARVNFDLVTREGVATFRHAMRDIADLVAEFGGSLSGEHGDGIARSELLGAIYPARIIQAFGDFKRIFDPDGMMNPGVIVNPHPLDSHLKLGPSYRPRPVSTHFDFTSDAGFSGAIMKCIGIGKCRKTDAGMMCPSYMATREEKHSTRGRARILFEALNSNLLKGGFTDDAVAEALDLCLGCKACKSECPASVDMATYKAEFLSHYYREHPRPFDVRFFAHIHELARLASIAPHVANALANAPVLGDMAKRILRIHPMRQLPRFATRTFRSWFGAREPRWRSDAREVVLFPDTFNNFFSPEVAIAATEVLERAGFRVTIPPRDICCGRPFYDAGMLGRARRRLIDAIDVLRPAIERGAFVVGLEPSCILTFRDEMPSLFPNDSRAAALRDRTMLLGEFLTREAPDFAPLAHDGRVLIHGHCHQKALAGMGDDTAILSRSSELKFDVLDSGCCGMAGPFGYSIDHYEVSKAAAERVLIPAIQSAPDAIVIADGFSCRTQIRHLC
ncbi:MAG TPA: FAD-linked oxidase C-terminal domain-containing protein, partial [Candidatus Binataceae bacterium]|nr:FAD-linked oxidase C-terminal domain-containing protein [Candidatus Binataceae bacterium]